MAARVATRTTAERFARHGIARKLVVVDGVGDSFPRDPGRYLRRAIRFAMRCDDGDERQ